MAGQHSSNIFKDEYLERVIVKNGKYVDRESVYKPGNRVRDVEVGPSGKIYVALEDPGRIVVLSPIPKTKQIKFLNQILTSSIIK